MTSTRDKRRSKQGRVPNIRFPLSLIALGCVSRFYILLYSEALSTITSGSLRCLSMHLELASSLLVLVGGILGTARYIRFYAGNRRRC